MDSFVHTQARPTSDPSSSLANGSLASLIVGDNQATSRFLAFGHSPFNHMIAVY